MTAPFCSQLPCGLAALSYSTTDFHPWAGRVCYGVVDGWGGLPVRSVPMPSVCLVSVECVLGVGAKCQVCVGCRCQLSALMSARDPLWCSCCWVYRDTCVRAAIAHPTASCVCAGPGACACLGPGLGPGCSGCAHALACVWAGRHACVRGPCANLRGCLVPFSQLPGSLACEGVSCRSRSCPDPWPARVSRAVLAAAWILCLRLAFEAT